MRRAIVLSLCIGCSGSASPPPPTTSTSVGEIIGGRNDGGHTYVVGVGDTSGAFCSGTVISAHTVITAGHCFTPGQPNGGITRVFFGPVVDPPSKAKKTIVVAQAIRDPGFDDNTLTDDLTIIQLAQPAPVQPAPLLRENMDGNPSEFIGPNFTFAGYGVNNGTAQSGFGTRRVVTFPIAALGPATVGGSVGTIDATQFYYDTPTKNTCNGDSGGPAFAIRNGVEHHAGTTSFGDGPCKLDGVQQRTDVPNIDAFIQANIDSFEANDPCRSDGVCNEACQAGQTELVDPDCAENH